MDIPDEPFFTMPFTDFWMHMLTHYNNALGYPHVLMLVLVVMLWMIDTSCVERGYAAMNRTHTKSRNGLSVKRVNHLMTIVALGPDVKDFDPKVVLEQWLQGPLGTKSERGRYMKAFLRNALKEITA